jgi:excisionase family DNA binding protein
MSCRITLTFSRIGQLEFSLGRPKTPAHESYGASCTFVTSDATTLAPGSLQSHCPASVSAAKCGQSPHQPRETITDVSDRELLTFAEVAARLGVDVNTVRRNVKADQIPVVRRGRKVRIPAAWVDDPQGWLSDDQR